MGSVSHNMYIGPPVFPVFNDREISNEPISSSDVVPYERSDSEGMTFAASASWSSNCEWYFMILPEGIALLNTFSRKGLLCRKHSSSFFDECLRSGILNRSINKPRAALKRGQG